MSFKWTREVVENLIALIQQHQCIYNVRSKEYLNRTKKCQVFNVICIEMQVKIPEISVPEIKKKWSNIRIQYMAEKRRILNSKKSGSGADDIKKPRLWCYDQLDFLNCHTQLRKSCSNIEGTSISQNFSSESTDQTQLRESCSSTEGTLISENFLSEPTDQTQLRERCSSTEDTSISESFSAESTDHFSRDKSSKNAPRKKEISQYSHAFAKDLAVLKYLAEKRSKDVKKYAWLGALVTSQMEDVSIDDQKAACWEVQCVMNKYVQKSRQSNFGTVSSPLHTNEGETAVTDCIMKKYIQKSQQKKPSPISLPLPRAEYDDIECEDNCDMSIEYLFDDDELNEAPK